MGFFKVRGDAQFLSRLTQKPLWSLGNRRHTILATDTPQGNPFWLFLSSALNKNQTKPSQSVAHCYTASVAALFYQFCSLCVSFKFISIGVESFKYLNEINKYWSALVPTQEFLSWLFSCQRDQITNNLEDYISDSKNVTCHYFLSFAGLQTESTGFKNSFVCILLGLLFSLNFNYVSLVFWMCFKLYLDFQSESKIHWFCLKCCNGVMFCWGEPALIIKGTQFLCFYNLLSA